MVYSTFILTRTSWSYKLWKYLQSSESHSLTNTTSHHLTNIDHASHNLHCTAQAIVQRRWFHVKLRRTTTVPNTTRYDTGSQGRRVPSTQTQQASPQKVIHAKNPALPRTTVAMDIDPMSRMDFLSVDWVFGAYRGRGNRGRHGVWGLWTKHILVQIAKVGGHVGQRTSGRGDVQHYFGSEEERGCGAW